MSQGFYGSLQSCAWLGPTEAQCWLRMVQAQLDVPSPAPPTSKRFYFASCLWHCIAESASRSIRGAKLSPVLLSSSRCSKLWLAKQKARLTSKQTSANARCSVFQWVPRILTTLPCNQTMSPHKGGVTPSHFPPIFLWCHGNLFVWLVAAYLSHHLKIWEIVVGPLVPFDYIT